MARFLYPLMGEPYGAIIRKRYGPYVENWLEVDRQASEDSIRSHQLNSLNLVWVKALETSAFYRHWREVHDLPTNIRSLEEYKKFPTLRKSDIQQAFSQIDFTAGKGPYASTGGSTGEPVKLPLAKEDSFDFKKRMLVARSWAGLEAGARYVHVWGHSHLFGQGRTRAIKKAVRGTKDYAVGALRLNAYDQSVDTAVEYVKRIAQFDPDYMVGYSSSLVRLASVISDGFCDPPELQNLKVIIATSDSLVSKDRSLIESIFGVEVLGEYGAAEVGLVAQERPGERAFSVLWQSLLLNEGAESTSRITTIGARRFPLFNYDLGDRIEPVGDASSVLRFKSLSGRATDQVELLTSDGKQVYVSGIIVVQIAKALEGVSSVQCHQSAADKLTVYVTGTRPLPLDDLHRLLRRELSTSLGVSIRTQMTVCQVTHAALSKSGKLSIHIGSDPAPESLVASFPERL